MFLLLNYGHDRLIITFVVSYKLTYTCGIRTIYPLSVVDGRTVNVGSVGVISTRLSAPTYSSELRSSILYRVETLLPLRVRSSLLFPKKICAIDTLLHYSPRRRSATNVRSSQCIYLHLAPSLGFWPAFERVAELSTCAAKRSHRRNSQRCCGWSED
jgi:hypothetical protein